MSADTGVLVVRGSRRAEIERLVALFGSSGMRKSFNGLYGLVRDRLLCDPLSGHMFLFSNAQRNRLKILFSDSSGLWVCSKRLEKGRFHWPRADDAQMIIVLSQEEFAMLLGGIDLAQTCRRRWYRNPVSEESRDTRIPHEHCI